MSPAYKLWIFFTEIDMLNKSLTVSQRNKVCLEEEMKSLKLLSDAAILRSQQMEASKQHEVNLQARCYELQKEALGKENLLMLAAGRNSDAAACSWCPNRLGLLNLSANMPNSNCNNCFLGSLCSPLQSGHLKRQD
jgi:hypothetical protein